MSLNEISLQDSEVSANTIGWQKHDTIWMLSLYGTSIGAGTLFLPINAGLYGLWPLLVMILLAFPMTFFSHRMLCRFILSGSGGKDITKVAEEHFGSKSGTILTLIYFLSIYPILLVYSVAITNTTQSFILNQLGMTPPPRPLLAILLLLGLTAVINLGQQTILRVMSIMVYPFITALILLSFYLIPYWNSNILLQIGSTNTSSHDYGLLITIWLIIPVMVFSFNHSPIISSFAVHQKENHGNQADKKCMHILRNSHLLMVITVMFFVLSCVLSLSATDLAEAKQQNISILSYLANHFENPFIAYFAPIIAFIAIAKSFLGHYLGTKEGMNGIITKYSKLFGCQYNDKTQNHLASLTILVSCWATAALNPSILGMIETLCSPFIAVILFLLPAYAITKVPALQKYRHQKFSNGFVLIIGIVTTTAVFFGMRG